MARKKTAGTKKARRKKRIKYPGGKTLWVWLGVEGIGSWVPVKINCECGYEPWRPPRPGKRPFEVIWTPCLRGPCDIEKQEIDECEGGYCEYLADGTLDHNGCKDLIGDCKCEERLMVEDMMEGGIGSITPCNFPPPPPPPTPPGKKPRRKTKRSRKK